MQYNKLNLFYFSATGTTQTIVHTIASKIDYPILRDINLLNETIHEIIINDNELTIIAAPVYSGRIPEIARKALTQIKANKAPAIIVCAYGNRDFDDALIELNDLVEANGFVVASAGAFIAQHSIFPKIAAGRPDDSDIAHLESFALESISQIIGPIESKLPIPGKRPYRPIKAIPLTPRSKRSCNSCGRCAKECPTQAIDRNNPKKTNSKKCISCAHCIAICPQKARAFSGLLYSLVARKFEKKHAARKEPYTILRD